VGGDPGFEANLWYLMKSPAGESILSFFPDPPMHVAPLFPLVMLVFFLLYIPFHYKNKSQ
jgi:uncharacterized membrane protein YwaF